eukprot:Unigene346_Nuclearia_a/m.1201 Unigene346_Nuclearia_a/g.1201  ORF Unigene346_Nuclearia_a/g.1201 Unigene346_Nuclearia_a/m.1201 type:complete len:276 (+) Unigene346_Nuclearia_a:2016-2843(+)
MTSSRDRLRRIGDETRQLVGRLLNGARLWPEQPDDLARAVAAGILATRVIGQLPAPESVAMRAQRAVEVVRADTFEAAARLRSERGCGRVCVLNMASERVPGGGFLSGASAQEESLCRRSSLYAAVRRCADDFPLEPHEAMYTRDVLVFRAPESDGCALLGQASFLVDVVSMAAPRVRDRGDWTATRAYENLWASKLQQLLAVVAAEGPDCDLLVLGAWGCGAFRNPPERVARFFRDALHGFRGRLPPLVVFAIHDVEGRRTGNLEAFREVFPAV